MRYSRPQASFTYRQHDYASVVGPVRSPLALGSSLDATGSGTGSASGVTGSSGGTRTARDHPLLRPDRPPGVCLTELVRDAAARLPNGEGTRQEIMQLVSESVFLVDQPNPAQLQTAVSSALDRLQSEGADACIYYNASRRVWVYRDRHRTMEEMMWRHRERCLAIAKRRSASSAAAASQRSQAAGGQTAGRSKLRKRGSTLSGQPGANSSGNAATPATAVSGGYSGESGPPNGTYLSRLTASTSHSRSCPSRVSHGGLRSSGRGTRPTRNCPAPVGQAGRSWVKQKVPGRIASDLSGGHFSPRTALGIDGYTNSARFDPNEFTVSHDALKRGDSYSGLEINKVCTQKGEDDIDEDLGGEDYDMEEDDDMEDMGEEEDYIPDIEELEAADLARQHQEAEWLRQQQHQQQQILPRGSQFSPLRPTSGYVPLDTHHPRPQQQQHKMQLQQQRQDQSKRQQQNSSLVQPFHRLDTVSGPARPQHARKPIPLATLRSQDEFPTDVSHPFDQHIQLPQHQRQMNPQSSLLSTHSNPVRSKPMRCHFVPANSSASSLELGAVSRQPPRSDDSYLSTQQHQRTVLSTVPPSGGGVFHGDWIETGCTSLMATNAATGFPRGYRVVRSIGPAEILRNAGGVPSVSLGHRERQGTCSMASQESNARDPDLGPSW